jgi:hypothetical protein
MKGKFADWGWPQAQSMRYNPRFGTVVNSVLCRGFPHDYKAKP